MTVEYAHLAYIVVALIVIVNIVDWVAFLLTERLTTTLNKRINANSSKFGEDAAMGEDLFLIERVTIITQSVLKCLDALIYISIMMFLIFFFSPILAVFLAPLLLLQIAFQVLSRRSNLKATEENRQIRDGYVFDSQTEGVKNKRLFSEDITERKRYVDSLENRRYSRNLKLHFDNFLGALVLVAVIFYLFSSEMEMDATRASLLILFIVALRQTVGLGKELSREFTALLDLRRDTDKLQYIIDANNLTKKE
ncbi:hypothetical protein [uncultured Cohaesibacter sp.]|uniref:hypothetical protein n=1 Tax=uncultured Cohaesibacter sp. TaxID=1002546 RepID=UPI0029319B73|nr:hypothetical protein [uncultured Cohaesibacter sp.]